MSAADHGAPILSGLPVLVIGAGIMGAGIAQVAAQAGHAVWLHDAREGAAAEARRRIGRGLEPLVAKGRLGADAAAALLARITAVSDLREAAGARLAVEAIVENLAAKRSLFRELEALLDEGAVLATNTSSISVTAIGNGLRRPGRLVGMHFFNPVPVMKLVEVVSGLQTEPAVAAAIENLSRDWGKVPVHARSSPGFIVNRIARPYYAETLALLQEQAATPAVLDACLRAAGFRMGPCELMDLIGHDTNFAVTQSVYEANFQDKRYVPSGVQRELVDGGLLGRKSGRGFYVYGEGGAPLGTGLSVPAEPPPEPPAGRASVMGAGPVAEQLAARLAAAGVEVERGSADWVGLQVGTAQLRQTDGRTAAELAVRTGVADLAVFDRLPVPGAPGSDLAWAAAGRASTAWRAAVPAWLALAGHRPQALADVPGLVVARTLAMLINEASDAVQQGVCDAAGADAAMKLGVNYPAGPFEWLAGWNAGAVVHLLEALDAHHRGERYRVSPLLRQRAWSAA